MRRGGGEGGIKDQKPKKSLKKELKTGGKNKYTPGTAAGCQAGVLGGPYLLGHYTEK